MLRLLVLLVTVTLGSSAIPRYEFAWNTDACCCHHAGPCPCPGHGLPGHDSDTSMRKCGSGGHDVASPSAPVFDLATPAIAEAVLAMRATPPALRTAHAAPDRERPSAPS